MSDTTEIVGKITELSRIAGIRHARCGVRVAGTMYLTSESVFRESCDLHIANALVIADVQDGEIVAIHAAKAVKVTA